MLIPILTLKNHIKEFWRVEQEYEFLTNMPGDSEIGDSGTNL